MNDSLPPGYDLASDPKQLQHAELYPQEVLDSLFGNPLAVIASCVQMCARCGKDTGNIDDIDGHVLCDACKEAVCAKHKSVTERNQDFRNRLKLSKRV